MTDASTSTTLLARFERPVTALVAGANRGIGLAFVRRLLEEGGIRRVWAGCRQPEDAVELQGLAREDARVRLLGVDVTDEGRLASAARTVAVEAEPLNLIINCAGLLHAAGGPQPERRLAEVRGDWLMQAFAVNGAGPLLLAKHFEALLPRRERVVFASLSARVGSIGDNRLGGWYAYRGSKAAQNMFLKTLSIELARRARGIVCVALHPGTTDTGLSAPFQGGVPADKLFGAERAAEQLLRVIDGLEPRANGGFFAWNGERIPW
ncbi:MAG: SDR family NAD(P)-dependent oxidoreductase [Gammaproteobacteria bacterium]|jgi:NAD(P)-dependent dehydrogenase (short-subunit alcohol dehydrogenase family)